MKGVNTIAALAAAVSRKHTPSRLGHARLGHARLGRARLGHKAGLLLAAVVTGLTLSLSAHAANPNQGKMFKVAADVGLVPFFMRGTDGKMDGFSNELSQEVAQRMGYDGAEVIDTPFSAIFAGLFSSRYDMVAAPTNTTQERAQQMLFAEPYMAGGLSFLAKKGATVNLLEDLKGKTIAVNNGSFSDRWLQDNQEKYGYKIQRFNKNTDAVQAVAIGRAFANMSETPLARYIATQTPALAPVYDMTTEANYAFAFRKDDTALRNRVDEVLECMKQDGALSKLHVKWFGTEPNAGTAMTVIFPGYGVPDFPGYESTEHTPDCSRP